MTSPDLVTTTKQEDFLDQDPPIRGQKYVCLSFISPEEVLRKKDEFFFSSYLTNFSEELNQLWGTMLDVHKDNIDFTDSLRSIRNRYEHLFTVDTLSNDLNYFTNSNGERLEGEFYEKNNFQTSMRGLKVRGTYDTMREAQIRAQVLKRIDDKFNVYIAEVGCWCPWSPNPEEIADQEFAETQLNTLMKKYQENQQQKDEFYSTRKDRMTSESRPRDTENDDIVVVDKINTEDILKELELVEDPWQQQKEQKEQKDKLDRIDDDVA